MEGKKTIAQVLDEAIGLLGTNIVQNHLKAAIMVHLELSMIQGFDKDPINVLGLYQQYLVHKHQSMKVVGFMEKAKGWWKARGEKAYLIRLINTCETRTYGDGDKFIKSILQLIRKAL